jgi:chromosome segregation ATPase
MDIEGTIQFIINQQAQFAADIARLEENLAKLGEDVSKLGENVFRLGENVSKLGENALRLGETALKHDARLDQVGETIFQITEVVSATAITQQNTNAILENLAERVVELSSQQAHTDERLNALIAIVERHITEHP